MSLTMKATLEVARVRKSYLAMPSESSMNGQAMPNMILHSMTQTKMALAPTSTSKLHL
jgi:hypothetical protein